MNKLSLQPGVTGTKMVRGFWRMSYFKAFTLALFRLGLLSFLSHRERTAVKQILSLLSLRKNQPNHKT